MKTVNELAREAQAASRVLGVSGTKEKNRALELIAEALHESECEILTANAEDLAAAEKAGMSRAMLDRLTLNASRIEGMCDAVRQVASYEDPVGSLISMTLRPNGLQVGKKRVPLGVVGIIYESRPNVTADAAVLCLKSGNACVLRGGREAVRSNSAIVQAMRGAVEKAGLPADCITFVEDTDRQSAVDMMTASGLIDVLIPRGGAGLIRSVVDNARVPVIETGVGNCHVYVDAECDLDMAARIIHNAKTSRPSVCNAAETLLVHEAVAEVFLPAAKKLLDEQNVEIRGDEKTCSVLGGCVIPVTEEDYETEFLDYILAVRVVGSAEEAMAHIERFGTRHSEAIVTSNYFTARHFLDRVDAAAVYVNASTRFTDGGEFGLGAEIGISTQKMHVRGPMGLEALTSVKYVICGDGQIR